MNFNPLGSRVLLEPVNQEQTTTASGLFIPEAVKEKPQYGIIVAKGPDVKEVEVNTKVLFGKYAGSEVKVDGKDYLLMDISDVLCIIEE